MLTLEKIFKSTYFALILCNLINAENNLSIINEPNDDKTESDKHEIMLPVKLTSQVTKMTTAQIMQNNTIAMPALKSAFKIKKGKAKGQQFIVKHFTAGDYFETGTYGPSSDGSVGSTQYLLGSKGRIRTFNKETGNIDGVLNISPDRFFSTTSLSAFLADPNTIFDKFSNRWFLFYATNGTALPPVSAYNANGILAPQIPTRAILAVSDGDPITPDTIWSFFVVDQSTNQGFDIFEPLFDYTNLGIDENYVYCGLNVYNNLISDVSLIQQPNVYKPKYNYTSSAVYVIPKDSIIRGKPKIFAFRNLVNRLTGRGPFAPQPAQNFDPNPSHGFFISVDLLGTQYAGISHTLLIDRVNFTKNSPTLTRNIQILVDAYADPVTVASLGNPNSIFTFGFDIQLLDARLSAAHIRNGKLWVTHQIGVNNKGESILFEPGINSENSTTPTRNGARFYEIDITKNIPIVITQGTLFQPSPENDQSARCYINPSIMTNKNGKVLLCTSVSSASEFINAAITQIINGIPQKTILYTDSKTSYFGTEDWEFDPFQRWGDHSRIQIDPTDDTTFWINQLWCSNKNIWAQEVAKVNL